MKVLNVVVRLQTMYTGKGVVEYRKAEEAMTFHKAKKQCDRLSSFRMKFNRWMFFLFEDAVSSEWIFGGYIPKGPDTVVGELG